MALQILKFIFVCAVLVGCDSNIYKSIDLNKTDAYYIEEVKINLNKGDYKSANTNLAKIKANTNEVVLLKVASLLGASGLNFLDVVSNMLSSTTTTTSSSSTDGSGKFFSALSDGLFGTGAERETRMAALQSSVDLLSTAPEASKKIDDFRCLLTGVIVTPRVSDGSQALSEATLALQEVGQNSVAATDSTAEQCPDLSNLHTAMSNLSNVQESFSVVLDQISSCAILQSLADSSGANQAQSMLNKLILNADKGCVTTPSCTPGDTFCQSLTLSCVQNVVGSVATAGDGVIDNCEFIQNCNVAGSCF